MKTRSLRIVLCVLIGLSFTSPFQKRALAQKQTSGESAFEMGNTATNILLGGLFGGILGLSTLSFYPEPRENIRNIYFGAGAGMIIAAFYITYTATQEAPPRNAFENRYLVSPILAANQFGVMYSLEY